MFTVIVTLDVIPDHLDEFLDGLHLNARASLEDEPKCFRFDVHQLKDDPHRFILYEIYASEHAFFEDHRQARHYAQWRDVTARCVVPGSQINSYALPVFPEDLPEHA